MRVVDSFLVIAVAVFSCGNAWGEAARQPNVLLIMADDVGSDAIGCYGGQSYVTPHIDSLADQGMKFNFAFSMPVCHPSRVSLMTGRYPFRFGSEGMRWGDFPKAGERDSIGNCMKRAGYRTAVAGKWQLSLMRNDLRQPERLGFDSWCLFGWHEGGRYHDPLIYQDGQRREDTPGRYGPDLYVEFLIDFMKQCRQTDQPFFAYYPMALCHDVTDDLKGEHVAYYRDGRWMTFAEMVSSMDDMVGRLLRAIDDLDASDETLVLYTTDNGSPAATYFTVQSDGSMARPKVFSIRNGKVVPGGKGKHSDSGTRVPLIARWTGKINAGTESDELVDLTDFLPSLLELAGQSDAGSKRDGISFAPVLMGDRREKTREFIYSEHRGKRSIRSGSHRLHGDGRFFNVNADPDESSPLDLDRLSDRDAKIHDDLTRQLSRMNTPDAN